MVNPYMVKQQKKVCTNIIMYKNFLFFPVEFFHMWINQRGEVNHMSHFATGCHAMFSMVWPLYSRSVVGFNT